MMKHGSTGSVNLLPIIAAYLNAAVWLKYGLLAHDRPLVAVNCIGMAASVLAVAAFYYNAQHEARGHAEHVLWRSLAALAAFTVAVWRGWLGITPVGYMAIAMGIALFAVPLVSFMYRLYFYQSVNLGARWPGLGQPPHQAYRFDLPSGVMGAVSCALWTAYGYADAADATIYVPNLCGLVFNVAQVLLATTVQKDRLSDRHALSKQSSLPILMSEKDDL